MEIRLPIHFATTEKLSFADLFGGRLARFGIQEHIEEGKTSNTHLCLADRHHHVWVSAANDGSVDKYHTHENVFYVGIFGAISEVFGVRIFSEHHYQFWGFSSKEEFEVSWERRSSLISEVDMAFFQAHWNSVRRATDEDELPW